MNIYFLTDQQTLPSEHYLKQLHQCERESDTVCIRKIIGINSSLDNCFGSDDLIIYYVNDEDELDALLSRRDFLSYSRLILLLPSSSTDTICKGLQLNPRVIQYNNVNQKNLLREIKKIASLNDKKYDRYSLIYGTRHN